MAEMSVEKISTRDVKLWRAIMIWACGGLFYCYQFIFRVSPSVMTDDLRVAFDANAFQIGNMSSYYYVAYAILQIPIGLLLDRFGPRKLLTLSCLMCTIGGIVFANAYTLPVASVGRFLMGAGSSCAFIGTLKLATLWFPLERVGLAAGVTMLLGFMGAAAGTPLAILIEYFGWREVIYLISLGGVLLSLIIWSIVRDAPKDKLALLKEASEGQSILFGLIKVISTPQVWLLAAYGCLMYVPIAAFADLWGVSFISKVYEIDIKVAAPMVTAVYVGAALGGPILAGLSDRLVSRRFPMILGAMATLILYMIVIYTSFIPQPVMFVLMFFCGFFFTGQVLCFASVCEQIPVSASGVGVGFTNMIVMMSGVVFEPLVGFFLDQSAAQTGSVAGVYSVEDFRFALMSMPLMILIAFILSKWFIRETHPRLNQKIS
ncbi:MAG: MFS transporter [Candidatus Nucleicultricaceae bacterium]